MPEQSESNFLSPMQTKLFPSASILTAALLAFATPCAKAQAAPKQNPPPDPNRPPQSAPLQRQTPPPQTAPPLQTPPPKVEPPQPPPQQQTPPPQPFISPAFGVPLNNLTSAQLSDFQTGLNQFNTADTPASGLGPIFNNVSCVACHSFGATGGASAITVTRYGKTVNGVFDPLSSEGGTLLHSMATIPALQEVIPADANVIAHRITTPLFGLGLVEAIPDAAIQANANRPKPDGIKGRASMITDVASGLKRVGRFGWKAQHATLIAFAGDAYQNEVGVTNRLFPHENAPNGNTALLAQYVDINAPYEDQTDADTGKADIDRLADFMQLLAPPPPLPLTVSSMAGGATFNRIGCVECHQRAMFTGTSAVASLSMKPVILWSDLLLHDMGALNDGIAQADATSHEMRTSMLWGLRARGPYLHDGRAKTLDAAILAHGGEAAKSSVRYSQLNAVQKRQLQDFLNSL